MVNRILQIKNITDAQAELQKIGVSTQGIVVMASKALDLVIKLTNVKVGAANILKQEMLSIGADAAVARGVVEGSVPQSDVILLGNADKIKKLIAKLEHQTIFGLPQIKEDLKKFLFQTVGEHPKKINFRGFEITFDETKIMGILNVTPDSFSDGGDFLTKEKAVNHALKMIADGADIIDIGGESSRPGAKKISQAEELNRIIPVISALREKTEIPISVDTYKAKVAEKAISAGASMINDISALRFDNNIIAVLQKHKDVPVVLMHMQGTPENMQTNPFYEDTVEEILEFFRERIDFCVSNGIAAERIIIDPGIGFGKRQEDNLIILKKISEFRSLGVPVLLGASRKSFIDRIYESSPAERLEGSLAVTALAHENQVEIVRVHDVKEHRNLMRVLSEIGKAK